MPLQAQLSVSGKNDVDLPGYARSLNIWLYFCDVITKTFSNTSSPTEFVDVDLKYSGQVAVYLSSFDRYKKKRYEGCISVPVRASVSEATDIFGEACITPMRMSTETTAIYNLMIESYGTK
ncbi:hypothetical protein CEXT_381501 [Caerostris extrusa]|uniref:Uncharacterized protein n=1 Tax=Caerostris extrusa TaxID=172846 RepID=A0AAV4SAY7_CAEEX|nr:hypothetical protein CEXT_381501 [Caerostris extrusa]